VTSKTLHEQLDNLPASPGVYLMKDVAGDVLYVGKAASLRSRVRSYFQPGAGLEPRLQSLVDQVHSLDFIVAGTEQEALVLEFNLIQKHRPHFNVRYRDDKSYPYIRVDLRDSFPMLCVIRQYAVVNDGARYFGPYPSTRAMWATIRLVRRLFGICQKLMASTKKRGGCTWKPEGRQRLRPCLDYYLGRCLGPCAGKVASEEYRRAVRQACDFLEGKHESVLAGLRRQMEEASAEMRFEAAGKLRDQITAIETAVGGAQRVTSLGHEDVDVIGYALQEDAGCVAVLQVREGRMVNQEHFLLEGVSGAPDEEVVNEFAKRHYQRAALAPRTVLLPLDIADAAAVERLLTERRETALHTAGGQAGRANRARVPRPRAVRERARASLLAPKRGEKRRLVAMAMENAAHHLRAVLERESVERRRGEEAVADLQKVMGLSVPPRRIEAFDISNIHGKTAVGSMIVFHDGQPRKSEYRRFRIQVASEEPNDYAMMHEVLSRRLKAAVSGNVKFARLPHLILVDGGAGQLGTAVRAMDSLGMRVPAAGLAKERELLYLPATPHPRSLPSHSRALHLLQQVRDEAHRFALSYHRSLRARQARESVLDGVSGIGAARKQRLMRHFGSLGRLRAAPAEEIAAVAGCSAATAAGVLAALAEEA
jgi:excinuclease ABC subunit C